MNIQDYIFIAIVALFCLWGMWNLIRMNRKPKEKPKRNWLKELRLEAIGKLRFEGCWSGYWTTTIMGVHYRSERVSGFKYVSEDNGTFIQDAIIDRCRLLRDADKDSDARKLSGYGRERYIDKNGRVTLF